MQGPLSRRGKSGGVFGAGVGRFRASAGDQKAAAGGRGPRRRPDGDSGPLCPAPLGLFPLARPLRRRVCAGGTKSDWRGT